MTDAPVYADLHTHTSRSDGTLDPERLVHRAAERGVRVLAVTDHDTVEGLPAAQNAAEEHDVQLLAGVELSVTEKDEEVHLLAYAIDPGHNALGEHLRSFREARRQRAWEMVDRLRRHGLTVDDELATSIFRETSAVGRPHVAAALVQAGHVESSRQAFDQYLSRDGPGFVPKPSVPAGETIAVVHEAEGIAVLAHPGHWTKGARIRRLIDCGLDGLEVIHPSHDASLRGYYERLATGYDLLMTGGSDYHGTNRDEPNRLGHCGLSRAQWERCRAHVA